MALKPRYKRRIIWAIIITIAVAAIAIILVPPLITLNNLKPRLEQTITEQTGIMARIDGDVHFSLLGRATIVAHNIALPNGTVGALMFAVPLGSIFNLDNARLTGDITVYDADITVHSLVPQNFNHALDIHNSVVLFKDKQYEIIDAIMDNGRLVGTVRTDQHKYDIDFEQDHFFIRNQNNKLELSGQLFADGSARGRISMETDDINAWFGFEYPRINKTVNLKMNFEWDGNYAWNFTDINMDNITGNIELMSNGAKKIQLRGENVDIDLSFLTQPSRVYYMTEFDLDFYGQMKFGGHEFRHIMVNAYGTDDALHINSVIADDIKITGGTIDSGGAHNLTINMPYDNVDALCVFFGTPSDWKCSRFEYGNYSGEISVSPTEFYLSLRSDKPMPDKNDIIQKMLKMAPRGRIDFEFSDIAGTYQIYDDRVVPSYKFANNKTLNWLDPQIQQTPQFMRGAVGDFSWDGDMMHFVPDSARWDLYLTNTYFRISGKNVKEWLPGIDTRALKNMGYTVSGTYSGTNVSNLEIKIAGHEFTGTVVGNNITLRTKLLNIDSFISQGYLDNYEELSFLSQSPIMILFDIPANISLYADAVIYNGNMFKNFVYALKPDSQTFSITDRDRGNLLGTISRNGNNYDIFIQLNKFATHGTLLSAQMPLNVRDAVITAEINMNTFGNIAHDLEYNMTGDMDLSFDGGYLIGIGVDDFFAAANQITTFNAEYALSYALDGGESAIKKMRIIGEYKNGDFQTTAPIQLQLRHTDATGELNISGGQMQAMLNMTLRGTSPTPQPIQLTITPDGTRQYMLSDIMTNFDPTYMRDFVRTHNKF